MDKEEAKLKIAELVDKYKKLSDKEIRALNEANTKQAFILPLFAALGWDIYDTNEVMLEEAASNGRVDFAFKINGVARFYVEAKKLGADLNNPDYIKQAITYAYNKGVTWAILTNFTELRMLNAQGNKPFLTLGHESYLNSFDKLWLLSKEAIQDNLLHKEADEYGVIPHAIPIEEKLFKQLRQWREALYNELFHYNEEWVKPEQRDELIEKLFNRLIFIRTAEDRKLEENKLRSAVHLWENNRHKAGELLDSLREIFAYYNGYYDSELFAPHLLDDNRLYIDEYLIANILNGLYDIPGGIASYDFSVIDADVLGRVYEQYLGYVSKHVAERAKQAQARLDLGFAIDTDYKLVEKKQHRKEQGIYYTPKFVTDYIVKETVGRFLQEHSYNENLNIKILDPACGSGSFLIRAYDELLNYHADVRSKSATEMDSFDRMPILTGNIFGVDLDQQAVEIARLNLLLRGLAKRDHLPPLTDNIKRGNSLISGTDEELKGYFGKNWRDKHPFNWEYEFKDIMANGGFDVVIGNPPYVRVDSLPTDDKTYWKGSFSTAIGKYDLYYLFFELASKLVKPNGIFAFITPNRFCTNSTGEKLRELLSSRGKMVVTSLSRLSVFEEAANYPVVTIVHYDGNKRITVNDIVDPTELTALKPKYELTNNDIKSLPRTIIPINVNSKCLNLALKVIKNQPFANRVVNINEALRIPTAWETDNPNGTPIVKQFQFSRYSPIKKVSYLSDSNFKKLNTGAARVTNCLDNKLIFAEDALRVEATLDLSKGLCQGGVYFATLKKKELSLCYLLGLFNSRLITFIFKSLYSGIHMGGGYLRFRSQYLDELPIRQIDFDNPAEKAMHDKLVSLVEKMLELNKKLAPIRDVFSHEKDELVKEIEKTDREIDELVYKLYELTPEEIAIVEGNGK
jgi:type I restriction-modification system DNA methylase subunit